MSGKTKNQHYVPQMYLNRFASGGEKLCVWKLETNQILENQNSRNYAAKRYFYDADKAKLNELAAEMASIHPEINNVIESEDVQFIEKGLCRAEGDASFVIDSIIQDHSQIYDRAIMQKLIIFVHDGLSPQKWTQEKCEKSNQSYRFESAGIEKQTED